MPLLINLLDSHKGWKGKIIRLKLSGGFRVSLEWKSTDKSQNRFFEAMEAEVALFTIVRKLSFSGNLVKNQVVGEKSIGFCLRLLLGRAEDLLLILLSRSGNPMVSVCPHEYPFSFF